MRRRDFLAACGAGLAASGAGLTGARGATDAGPQLAVTIDDIAAGASFDLTAAERHRRMMDALARRSKLKAAIFVRGKLLDSEEGRPLLRAWDDGGHLIGNHTYSHQFYHSQKLTFEDFSADVLRGEAVIKDLKNFRRLFRFPYLKEGDTVAKRERMRAFLKRHGYRNGHVTIDASDWYVAQRMAERLKQNPKADLTGYRDFYLAHMWERATFYDGLARRVANRPVSHTILIHDNHLNALFLSDLLRMFEDKGWRLIDAEKAFADPVFSAEPNILPAGESIVWALAKESKRFDAELRYPGEDGPYEKEKMDRLRL
jgi:peptidoglycan-N-acetylglucosamine deacetylase